MAADIVSIVVNGRKYSGMTSARITRSIKTLAGSFALEVSDRWDGESDPWPIQNEDACRVMIDDEVMIDGFVDTTDIDATADSRTLRYGGKDAAAAIVENSATVQGASVKAKAGAGGGDRDTTKHSAESVKWSYTNIDVVAFTRAIAAPFGLAVSVQSGLVTKRIAREIVNPGDTGWEAVKRVAEAAGVLLVSDGRGGILITRSGKARAANLIEGFNIKLASRHSDATQRFRRYLLSCQVPGTDEAFGEATQIQATATDDDVRRASRILLVRPDKGYSAADARARADWEARIRAARSEELSCTVVGWRQPNGELWPVNALTRVTAPRMLGVDGEMLIAEAEFTIDDRSGRLTKLSLVRPDAFAPEPSATVSGESGWDELRKGV